MSSCVMLSAPDVQGKGILVVDANLMLPYLWVALSFFICKGKNSAACLNLCWHRKCLWSFSTAKMEKTLTEVHHSLPIAPACSAAGLPCVVICLSLSLKREEIREILKHAELPWFQVEVHMWESLYNRTWKAYFWKKYNLSIFLISPGKKNGAF